MISANSFESKIIHRERAEKRAKNTRRNARAHGIASIDCRYRCDERFSGRARIGWCQAGPSARPRGEAGYAPYGLSVGSWRGRFAAKPKMGRRGTMQ
jgi:hypothetical protein